MFGFFAVVDGYDAIVAGFVDSSDADDFIANNSNDNLRKRPAEVELEDIHFTDEVDSNEEEE